MRVPLFRTSSRFSTAALFSFAAFAVPFVMFLAAGCGAPPKKEEGPVVSLNRIDFSPWQRAAQTEYYTIDDLDLIVGKNVDLFKAYKIDTIQLQMLNLYGTRIRVLLFRCPSSQEAFNVFALQRAREGLVQMLEGETEQAITMETPSLLAWEGHYFLWLQTVADSPATEGQLTEAAAKVLGAVNEMSRKPVMAAALPQEYLKPESVMLFRYNDALKEVYTAPQNDLFRLGDQGDADAAPEAEALYAHYMFPKYDARFFALIYHEEERADEVAFTLSEMYRKTAETYRHNRSGLQEAEQKDGETALIFQEGRLLIFIPPTRADSACRVVIQEFLKNLSS